MNLSLKIDEIEINLKENIEETIIQLVLEEEELPKSRNGNRINSFEIEEERM